MLFGKNAGGKIPQGKENYYRQDERGGRRNKSLFDDWFFVFVYDFILDVFCLSQEIILQTVDLDLRQGGKFGKKIAQVPEVVDLMGLRRIDRPLDVAVFGPDEIKRCGKEKQENKITVTEPVSDGKRNQNGGEIIYNIVNHLQISVNPPGKSIGNFIDEITYRSVL